MDVAEEITKEDVVWLLHHRSKFTIEFSDIKADIRGIYDYPPEPISDGIMIRCWENKGFAIKTDQKEYDVESADKALSIFNELGMPDNGIKLTRYMIQNGGYYSYGSDNMYDYFCPFFRAKKNAEFLEISMNGLLEKYAPVSDSIVLYVIIYDHKETTENYKLKKPKEANETAEKFEKVWKINEDPYAALCYLGAPQLTDSLLRATVGSVIGNIGYYECEMKFRLDETVISWMRTFKTDYEMGLFEDLCFLNGETLLYSSISHEYMRSDGNSLLNRW